MTQSMELGREHYLFNGRRGSELLLARGTAKEDRIGLVLNGNTIRCVLLKELVARVIAQFHVP